MRKLLTPNEIQIAVNKIGYDIFPVKQKNGMYKMGVWFGDEKYHGLGKKEYKYWEDGVNETYKNFALKFGILKQ